MSRQFAARDPRQFPVKAVTARFGSQSSVVMTAAGDKIIGLELESLNVPVLTKPLDVANLAEMVARYTHAKQHVAEIA